MSSRQETNGKKPTIREMFPHAGDSSPEGPGRPQYFENLTDLNAADKASLEAALKNFNELKATLKDSYAGDEFAIIRDKGRETYSLIYLRSDRNAENPYWRYTFKFNTPNELLALSTSALDGLSKRNYGKYWMISDLIDEELLNSIILNEVRRT
jgi:hypothetical protein